VVRLLALVLGVGSTRHCDCTDVARLEDVTRGMGNRQFRRWYRGKVLDRRDANATRVALKRFFGFLDREAGIHNLKALEALR
jgi:hypothetical protein